MAGSIPDDWDAIVEAAELRNCIVHHAGIARDSKCPVLLDRLESRKCQGEGIGIKIYRHDDGRDVGLPIVVEQRFVQYYLGLLDELFSALEVKVGSEFWSKRKGG